MNSDLRLYPPLDVIRDRLFGETEPAATAAPEAAATDEPSTAPAMPAWMKSLVADGLRQKAQPLPQTVGEGQIWSVAYETETGSGRISGRIPLLLDRQKENGAWEGWVMSADTDYAAYTDVILDFQAAAINPVATMVQTWNRISVQVDAAAPYLGRLDADTLDLVRAVATEPQPGYAPKGQPGNLAPRQVQAGRYALTGDYLGDARDPRWAYRRCYLELANAFTPDLSPDKNPDI